MAYDEVLAERIRELIDEYPDLVEKKMFGGLAFIIQGNMAVGVTKGDLMVRTGPENSEEALKRQGARPSEMGGRTMRGWVLVDPSSLTEDARLTDWIRIGAAYALSLPVK